MVVIDVDQVLDLDRKRRGSDGRLHYLNQAMPDGPWHHESDRVKIWCAGFVCVLDREDLGNWAGYVALPTNHPWVANDLDPTLESGEWHDAVHGGIMYCNERSPILDSGNSSSIWIGFDCAHAILGDMIPVFRNPGTYRDYKFAFDELCRLAEAASAAVARQT